MTAIFNFLRTIRNTHPDYHAIAKSMVSIALFILLGKLAGAGKEMAIAYCYGISNAVDAYLLVFNLISWPVAVWFSVLTSVLVPLSSRMQQNQASDIAKFRAELLGFSLSFGLILALAVGLGLPALLNSSWFGLSEATRSVAIKATPSMLILTPLGVLISLFSAWLLAAGRHVNTLLESVPALAISIAVLLLPNQGIETLVWGTVVGLFLQLVSLAISLAVCGEIEKPCFTQHSPQWSGFWQGFGIMLAGQTLMSFTTLIDQFFAVRLDTGAITTLSYANRILALILGLGATVVGRATLPIFSKIHASDEKQLYKMATRWAGLLFTIGVVAMLIAWWLAPWGIKLLFERGAFSAQNSQSVTEVFRYSVAQLPFYFASSVLLSYAASKRLYTLFFWSSVIGVVVKIIANAVLVPLFAIKGIALAWVVVYMFNAFFFLVILVNSK